MVSPLDHEYEYKPFSSLVPPVTSIAIDPSAAPLQLIFVIVLLMSSGASGCVKVRFDISFSHSLASVTLTV